MTTDPGAIKKTVRKCHEQLHTHKFSNLKEMDSFLKTTNYQKLSEDEIESLNDPITTKEIEFIISGRFIQVAMCINSLLHFIAEQHLMVWVYANCLPVHLLKDFWAFPT